MNLLKTDNDFVMQVRAELLQKKKDFFFSSHASLSSEKWKLYLFESIDSTMDFGKALLRNEGSLLTPFSFFDEQPVAPGVPACILSCSQEAGRGQEGRSWFSPFSQGVYVSYAFFVPPQSVSFAAFSLACGVIVSRALETFGGKADLKWPNDIISLENESGCYRKVGGILVELFSSGQEATGIVVGIGLNVSGSQFPKEVPGISLQTMIQREISVSEVFVELTKQFLHGLAEYLMVGFSGFKEEWERSSIMKGRKIASQQHGEKILGYVTGLNNDGSLVITTSEKVVHLYSGSVEFITV